MKSSPHYYVIDHTNGVFTAAPFVSKHGHVIARFATRSEAIAYAKKCRRDFLSPAFDIDGHLLTPRERPVLGVWHPDLYEQALQMAKAHPEGPGVNVATNNVEVTA
jgi:hypothetical protein